MVQCEEMDPVVEKPLSFESSSCMQGHHQKKHEMTEHLPRLSDDSQKLG